MIRVSGNQKGSAPALILILILIALLGAGGLLGFRYFNNRPVINSQTTTVPSPLTSGIVSDELSKQILQDIESFLPCGDLEGANGNVVKGNCGVDKVVGDYAKGTMPQAYWMAEKINSKWRVVITGNGFPKCEEIDRYSIPKEIYGDCTEKSGQLRFQKNY